MGEEEEELDEKVHTLEEKYKDIRKEGNELSEKAGKLEELYSLAGEKIRASEPFNTKGEEDFDLIDRTNSLLDDEIKKADEVRDEIETINEDFYTSGTVVGATLTTVNVEMLSKDTGTDVDQEIQFIESIGDNDEEKIRRKLNDLSPGLGDSYRAISEKLYSGSVDRLRSALLETRQTLDHFLDELAPDEDVRKSEFWEPKKEKEREKDVHRREKLEYLLDKYSVKRPEAIEKKADHIKTAYDKLNKLHKRGNLNKEEEVLKSAIVEIKMFLKELITEVGEF